MPLYKLNEAELRNVSKNYIETLEFWLRRIIDTKLSEVYGNNYWEYCDQDIYLIKKEIREKATDRFNKYPERFSRWIDATLIEHLIDIICKEKLYKEFFKGYFEYNFPLGREQLRLNLTRLSEIRNRLYHSNPISIRQAEQAICYTNDMIESIKEFYLNTNQQMEFNSPSIISISFSNGTKIYKDSMTQASNGSIYRIRNTKFRCGDRLKMEIEVDSTFDEKDYIIFWDFNSIENIEIDKKSIEIQFLEQHVAELFKISVKIISNKNWHRYRNYDDSLSISLTVLPPV